jgi:hypothetical protein
VTPRWKFWLIGGLVIAVVAAAIYLPILRKQVKRAAKLLQQSEEQARRELTQPVVINPSDPRVKTKLFWASDTIDSTLVPVTVDLPLSNEPVLRSKQVLNTLLAGPVDAELRTLPPDAVLLAFYLMPDGTAIADFSEALATSIPSGIVSEQMAVNSITRTLEANVPQVQRLKILIHGQEVETLAGHLDLTGTFVVNTKPAQAPVKTAPAPSVADKPATPAAEKAPAPAPRPLTPGATPGKLAQPERKP